MDELLKLSDELVHVSVFHTEFAEVVMSSLVFGIVDKGFAKFAFKDFPGGHAPWEVGDRVFSHFVEPVVLSEGPSCYLSPFD
jgi:hypothetical protein